MNVGRNNTRSNTESIREIKNQLIDQFILIGAILGLIIFVISLFPWQQSYLNSDFFIDVFIQVLVFGIYGFRHRFTLETKAKIIILLLLIAFTSDVIENHVYATGVSLIILVPFISILAFSLRTTVLTFSCGILIYMIIAFAYLNGFFEATDYVNNEFSLTDWILNISTILMNSIIISLFVKRYNLSVDQMIEKLQNANTELADRDNKLEKSLSEKNVMLQEIHHRVKNNLAVVSGLLNLQSSNIDDQYVKNALSKSIHRIMSIAKVHELLYQSDDLSMINLHKYVEELTTIHLQSFSKSEKQLFKNTIELEHIDINYGVPLGIIFNELITNSLKHAFIGEYHIPEIRISIKKINDTVFVEYADNGVGILNFEEARTESLGFTLIKSLLDQIEASYEYDLNNQFKLSFFFTITAI